MEGRIEYLVLIEAEIEVICLQVREHQRLPEPPESKRSFYRYPFRVEGNRLRDRWLLRNHACSTKFMPHFPFSLCWSQSCRKLKILSDWVTFPASWPCYNLCILSDSWEVLFVNCLPSFFPHSHKVKHYRAETWVEEGGNMLVILLLCPDPPSTLVPCSVSPEPEHMTELSELILVFLLSPIFLALLKGAMGRRGFPNIENRPVSYPLA